MAEMQNELKVGIGNEDSVSMLKPANVKIVDVKVEEVGVKKAKKVICSCQHPDSPAPVQMSSVKYEIKGKLEDAGLWFNLDSKGAIKKLSALSTFMNHLGVKTLEELKGKEAQTIVGATGYLTFKAY